MQVEKAAAHVYRTEKRRRSHEEAVLEDPVDHVGAPSTFRNTISFQCEQAFTSAKMLLESENVKLISLWSFKWLPSGYVNDNTKVSDKHT